MPPLVHDLHDGPDLPDDVAASRRAAAAARRVVAGLTASRADPVTLDEVTAVLDRVADTLDPHRVETRWTTPDAGLDIGANPHASEAHPLLGPSHPFAPPLRVERHGDHAVGLATFGHVYEGPPSIVHGGVVAAVFDVVVLSAAVISRVAGLTGTLTVRYRTPTPLFRTIRFESWIHDVRERTVVVHGRSTIDGGDGAVLAEAEGILVRPRDAAGDVVPIGVVS